MKLLLANPNTSQAVTDRIAAVARSAASAGTTIQAVTAAAGVPYIATRADAAVVAAFGDPGLAAARELLDIPVVGMAEAAMLTACMLGRRFGIVTFAPALGPWYREIVDYNGLEARCSGVHCLDEAFADVVHVAEEKSAQLAALCATAVAAGAEVCILGGAPLAGLAAAIAQQVAVPLVDAVAAAVRQAETLASLRPRKPVAGSFRRPEAKPMTGLPAPLVRLFGGTG